MERSRDESPARPSLSPANHQEIPAGTVEVSHSTLTTILDQLRRLNRNGDEHDQQIDALKAELRSLKPQVETLTVENTSLKQEVELLRAQLREVQHVAPSAQDFPQTRSASLLLIPQSSRVGSIKPERNSITGISDAQAGKQPENVDDTGTVNPESSKEPSASTKTLNPNTPKEDVEMPDDDDTKVANEDDEPTGPRRGTRKRKAAEKVLYHASKGDEDDAVSVSARISKRPKKEHTSRDTPNAVKKQEPTSPSVSRPNANAEPGPSQIIPLPSKIEKKRTQIPKNKIKPDALSINPTTLSTHLSSTPTLTIHPPPLALAFPKALLTDAYGASPQSLLWVQNAEKAGLADAALAKRFISPTYETNPDMPAAPGEPGLLLCARTEVTVGTWTLFIRVLEPTKGVKWNYAGEYASETVGVLSPEEFRSKSQKVKETWGKKIAEAKGVRVYAEMRARVTLRKDGREVTRESVEEELGRIQSTQKGNSRLKSQDVVDAFESGEEKIPIVRMQCVSYNQEFAQELLSKQTASEKKS